MIIGRTNCNITEKCNKYISSIPYQPQSKFLEHLQQCKWIFVPNISDASPRVVTQAMSYNMPALMNKNIIGGWKYKPDLLNKNNLLTQDALSNTHSLGQVLYTDYIHIFQISGMVLLVAMIGAIVLTFRQRSGVKKQSYINQISRERSESVEVLEVQKNKGVRIDD